MSLTVRTAIFPGGPVASAWIGGVSFYKKEVRNAEMGLGIWSTWKQGLRETEVQNPSLLSSSSLCGHLQVYPFPSPKPWSRGRINMIVNSQGKFLRQQIPMRKSIIPRQQTPVCFWRYWALAEKCQFAQHAIGKRLSGQNKNKSKI